MNDEDDLRTLLDDDEIRAILALTDADIKAIDEAILSQLSVHWQKTALVVSVAMDAYPEKYFDIPDLFYGERVVALFAKGLIEANGNLRRMRSSEVRMLAQAS